MIIENDLLPKLRKMRKRDKQILPFEKVRTIRTYVSQLNSEHYGVKKWSSVSDKKNRTVTVKRVQ